MAPRLTADERAEALAAVMTTEEKLNLFEANPSTPIPELGIPSRKEKDGCCGVSLADSLNTPTTALPKSISLASTFSEALAREYGVQIGRESWRTGFAGATAPTSDIIRSPHFGRRGESFSEDPLLAGRLPASVVEGVQAQEGVYSLAKHYVGNYQETSRQGVNQLIEERALHEIFARPWEHIVKSANPGAIMCAFQQVNSEYACANSHLVQDILKDDWGFPGWVSSDFNACPDYTAYTQGVDICAPDLGRASVEQALADGTLSEERFDDMVHRILRTFFEQGVIDNPPPGALDVPSADVPGGVVPAFMLDDGAELSRRVAAEGTVLLKNRRRTLPLSPNDSIALIGPDADRYIDMFGSPSVPNPGRLTTIVDGITERSAAEVTYSEGADTTRYGDTLGGPAPVPSAVLTPAGASGDERGVRASYFVGFQGDSPQNPSEVRIEDQVNHRTGTGGLIGIFGLNPSPAPLISLTFATQPMTALYEGSLRPVRSGTYQLGVRGMGTFKLTVNGQTLVEENQVGLNNYLEPIDLVAGQDYEIRLTYQDDTPGQCCGSDVPGPTVRLAWEPPTASASPQIQDAVDAAREADVAVVVASTLEGEATDLHSLQLPQDQDRLIRAVARANPNTVVVLATGGPVLTPWRDRVPTLLEAWFSGEEQGSALADVLYGDVNPGGKLPLTFPATESQPEEIGIQNPSLGFNIANPTVRFDEGVGVGYRGYDAERLTPAFAFGHGLSYTTFRYSNLRIKNPRGWKAGVVAVRVRNTGRRTGTEVVQLYNGRLPTSVSTPPRQLAGWARVTLRPGQSKTVRIRVNPGGSDRVLSYWRVSDNEVGGRWVTPKGRVRIYVGSSSRDIRLRGTMLVR
ncbi:glycoside hydrolase family 3 protein [Mumia sp. Pv 4-285]|uniref:glycoside hydrolase family 3 protein n=1 Tax=Mumia qirimensis TaxID=3234852 RepID=UPI00351CD4DB